MKNKKNTGKKENAQTNKSCTVGAILMIASICLGLIVGAVAGYFADDFGLFVSLGACVGICVGTALFSCRKN